MEGQYTSTLGFSSITTDRHNLALSFLLRLSTAVLSPTLTGRAQQALWQAPAPQGSPIHLTLRLFFNQPKRGWWKHACSMAFRVGVMHTFLPTWLTQVEINQSINAKRRSLFFPFKPMLASPTAQSWYQSSIASILSWHHAEYVTCHAHNTLLNMAANTTLEKFSLFEYVAHIR